MCYRHAVHLRTGLGGQLQRLLANVHAATQAGPQSGFTRHPRLSIHHVKHESTLPSRSPSPAPAPTNTLAHRSLARKPTYVDGQAPRRVSDQPLRGGDGHAGRVHVRVVRGEGVELLRQLRHAGPLLRVLPSHEGCERDGCAAVRRVTLSLCSMHGADT